MGDVKKKYHITDDGKIYRIADNGEVTKMGDVSEVDREGSGPLPALIGLPNPKRLHHVPVRSVRSLRTKRITVACY